MCRLRGKNPPKTAAQRQKKCRAIKRGTWVTYPNIAPPGLLTPDAINPNLMLPPPGTNAPALPAPPTTSIQKAGSTHNSALALPDADEPSEPLHLSLPPAGADRLRALLVRQFAGKKLTAAERDEAQGLLDLAELFVIQRLRNRLAA